MPHVSVIIPTYNRARLLQQSIESVLQQTFADFEIIVIDDGSKDDTRHLVKNLQNQDPRIQYVYQENRGHSAARNTGLQNASGEWIAMLDSDDLWLPRKLTVQMAAVQQNPDADFFYCNGTVIDESGKLDEERTTALRSDRLYTPDIILFEYATILTSGVLFRKNCLDKAGLFDESLDFFEDLDLWFRILLSHKAYFINEDLIVKRKHAENFAATHGDLPTVASLRSYWHMRRKAVSLYQSHVRKLTRTELQIALYNHQRNLIKECLANGLSKEARSEAISYTKANPVSMGAVYFLLSIVPSQIVQHVISRHRKRLA